MIVFASTRSGNYDLYAAYADELGNWGLPVALRELDTPVNETHPVISADGLSLYFARRLATGIDQIYVSRRSMLNVAWGPPRRLSELSATVSAQPAWISADDCVLYLTSSGGTGGVGSTDIYVAERAK
jgi:hypothetical protein